MRSMFNGKSGAVLEPAVAAPSGMAMMLKSMLGIDPAEIMQAAEAIKNAVESFDRRLGKIESDLREIRATQVAATIPAFPATESGTAERSAVDAGGYGAAASHHGAESVALDDGDRK